MWRKVFTSVVTLLCAAALIPSAAFASNVWDDSAFLPQSYSISALTWTESSSIECSGGAYRIVDWAPNPGVTTYCRMSVGSTIRYTHLNTLDGEHFVDMELYGVAGGGIGIITGSPNDPANLQPGDLFGFWVTANGLPDAGRATMEFSISLYETGTNILVDADLCFGVYDIDATNPDHVVTSPFDSMWPERFWCMDEGVSMYRFENSRIMWNDKYVWSPGQLDARGYDRSCACYVVTSDATVTVGFAGAGCGMCYSFQGVNFSPDSPDKLFLMDW